MKKILIVQLLLSSSLLWAGDWPIWLGPDGTGVSTESNWKNNLEEQAWKTKVGLGFSTVSVADGRLYTMGHDGRKSGGNETVYCLDAKTGKAVWTHSYPAPLVDYLHEGGPCSTPTVEGSTVYALSKHGILHAYLAKDGKILWKKEMMKAAGMRKPPEWGFAASPYLLGDLLLIEAGATFALDKKTGETKWKSQIYRAAYGSPTSFKAGDSNLVAILKTDGLVILDSANGKTLAFEKWETSYRTNSTTPIVRGNKIFISTGYRRGCALFKFQGNALTKIYEKKTLSTHMNNAIPVGNYLYGFDGNVHMAGPKDLVCINFSTGEEQWRDKSNLQVGSLIVADNRIIALGQRGEAAIAPVSPKGFKPIVREQVIGGRCWTSPVLANGYLYLRNARGDLVCLDLRQ
ncbi:MAG: PQQ-like beta-propeller repeat protein [Opitutae bacterium]|jgi:outer membrane protein assembly factor BamB|nr:PQQ-like beta-propeller repeat protein [Opitutae bacterium]